MVGPLLIWRNLPPKIFLPPEYCRRADLGAAVSAAQTQYLGGEVYRAMAARHSISISGTVLADSGHRHGGGRALVAEGQAKRAR